jgi:hypothetical protein
MLPKQNSKLSKNQRVAQVQNLDGMQKMKPKQKQSGPTCKLCSQDQITLPKVTTWLVTWQ